MTSRHTISDGTVNLKRKSENRRGTQYLNLDDLPGSIGVGHTAGNHGAPSKSTATTLITGEIVVVHNES
jgi:glucosamine 6-phosphate synthetase-like amidotransferase/phosphosugar isomerase protein